LYSQRNGKRITVYESLLTIHSRILVCSQKSWIIKACKILILLLVLNEVKIAVSREGKNTRWKCLKKCWGSIDIVDIYMYIYQQYFIYRKYSYMFRCICIIRVALSFYTARVTEVHLFSIVTLLQVTYRYSKKSPTFWKGKETSIIV
jgi:hypothetical protein